MQLLSLGGEKGVQQIFGAGVSSRYHGAGLFCGLLPDLLLPLDGFHRVPRSNGSDSSGKEGRKIHNSRGVSDWKAKKSREIEASNPSLLRYRADFN